MTVALNTFLYLLLTALAILAIDVGARELEGKPPPRALPEQTPMSGHGLDKNGVVIAYMPDGTPAYNIFLVAMQALRGKDVIQQYLGAPPTKEAGLLPRLPAKKTNSFSDPYRTAAYQWLIKNAVSIKDDGLIWYYQFDNAYNDVLVVAPWGSAFGQAHVMQAFVQAYQETDKDIYRDLALRASKPFFLPIKEGGVQSTLSDGNLFFEEIPVEPATHILNGHLISTLALLETAQAVDDEQMLALARRGIKTLQRHLWRYDLGYWSRYDLNPKKFEILFRLAPLSQDIVDAFFLDSVQLVDPNTAKSTDLDIGAPNDADGAWRITGVEWRPAEIKEGRTVRSILFGPARHKVPVKGGSMQNSYLMLELPDKMFEEYTGDEKYLLKLNYFDAAPCRILVQIQKANAGEFLAFNTLRLGELTTSGSKNWKSTYIPISSKDLAWYTGSDYQQYHIDLLKRLYQLTNEAIFESYAVRWQNYLDAYEARNVETILWEHTSLNTLVP